MTPDVLQSLPGYGLNVAKNRAEARDIMQKLGYGPDKRLSFSFRRAMSRGIATLR